MAGAMREGQKNGAERPRTVWSGALFCYAFSLPVRRYRSCTGIRRKCRALPRRISSPAGESRWGNRRPTLGCAPILVT